MQRSSSGLSSPTHELIALGDHARKSSVAPHTSHSNVRRLVRSMPTAQSGRVGREPRRGLFPRPVHTRRPAMAVVLVQRDFFRDQVARTFGPPPRIRGILTESGGRGEREPSERWKIGERRTREHDAPLHLARRHDELADVRDVLERRPPYIARLGRP